MHPMDPNRERSFPHRESSAERVTGTAVLSLGPDGLALGEFTVQQPTVVHEPPATKTRTILDEAASLTSGDRQRAYGHPRKHFGCTAAMVSAYLVRKGWTPPPGTALDGKDWACLIALDKIARYAGGRKRDCLVDLAGYARTAEMLDEP